MGPPGPDVSVYPNRVPTLRSPPLLLPGHVEEGRVGRCGRGNLRSDEETTPDASLEGCPPLSLALSASRQCASWVELLLRQRTHEPHVAPVGHDQEAPLQLDHRPLAHRPERLEDLEPDLLEELGDQEVEP